MNAVSNSKRAVVLLSGGLDSATCLAVAKQQGFICYAISFHYGQRARSELDAARQVVKSQSIDWHRVIELNLEQVGGSALTDFSQPIPEHETAGIPSTYVPARNTLFLSYALAWSEVIQAKAIFIGVNARDYSGYPDCRPEFISAFESMANLATKAAVEGRKIKICTPLIDLSKAQIIQLGASLNVNFGETVSCYQADQQGRACGVCDSCRFRKQGFIDAGVADPTRYQK